jgi:hypothetical protein
VPSRKRSETTKGRITKRYRYELPMTPYKTPKSLPSAEIFLKPDLSFEKLDAIALVQSDNARLLNQAPKGPFQSIIDPAEKSERPNRV